MTNGIDASTKGLDGSGISQLWRVVLFIQSGFRRIAVWLNWLRWLIVRSSCCTRLDFAALSNGGDTKGDVSRVHSPVERNDEWMRVSGQDRS